MTVIVTSVQVMGVEGEALEVDDLRATANDLVEDVVRAHFS